MKTQVLRSGRWIGRCPIVRVHPRPQRVATVARWVGSGAVRQPCARCVVSLRANRIPHRIGAVRSGAAQKTADSTFQSYTYTHQSGTPVLVGVSTDLESCRVTLSVPFSDGLTDAEFQWGLFRKEKENWHRPDGSCIDAASNRIQTTLASSQSHGAFEATLEIPLKHCPCYLGGQMLLNGEAVSEDTPLMRIPLGIERGQPSPKGVQPLLAQESDQKALINFAVVSRNASSITLCLLDDALSDPLELELFPEHHKTGDVWHIALETNRKLYGWKADGTLGWEGGSRFHSDVLLMDPYSRTILPVTNPANDAKEVFLGTVETDSDPVFDWERAPRPRYGFEHLVVSELDLTSLPAKPVLEAALEMTAKMAQAGVNCVILRGAMLSVRDAVSGTVSPLSFFAPHSQIFQSDTPSQSSHQLKTLIRECHKQALEVLLEVQFCFTAEDAVWMSLKGLDVSLYFRGKGILNCGHPIVQELVLDALHHWVQEYKVDGFVFLNAETMAQDRDGTIQDAPALPQAIAADPLLKGCKLVAVNGDDQLLPRQGERGFPHWGVWTEYNTRFQYDFWGFMVMGANAKLSNIATRMTGSADLFAACWDGGFPGSLAAGRRPAFGFNSPVRFFTPLKESVDADVPHKQILGEDQPSPHSLALVCSLLTASVVAQGVPVSPMDCWMDETLSQYLHKLLSFRSGYLDLIQPEAFDAIRGIEWHGALSGHQPDWDGGMHSHFIGYSLRDGADRGFYVGFNGYSTEIEVQSPDAAPGMTWKVVAYTGLPLAEKEILVPPHSMFHMSPKTTVIMEIIATTAIPEE